MVGGTRHSEGRKRSYQGKKLLSEKREIFKIYNLLVDKVQEKLYYCKAIEKKWEGTMEKETIVPVMTKKELYEKQMELLNMFLERGAITREQYEKSSKDLKEKMGFGKIDEKE